MLILDPWLKLRDSRHDHVAIVYGTAVEFTRHGPRSVHVMGGNADLRAAVGRVVVSAHPDLPVTIDATAGTELPRPVSAAVVDDRGPWKEWATDDGPEPPPVVVELVRDATLGPVAKHSAPLYPGCDVVLILDPTLGLRGASLRDQSVVYALALEHSRHAPRSVRIEGVADVGKGSIHQRQALAAVLTAAHPGTVVTYAPSVGGPGLPAPLWIKPARTVLDNA